MGYGIKCMWQIFENKMLIYQSKATLDVRILFGKITYLKIPKIRKLSARNMYGSENSTVHLVEDSLAIAIKILFLKLVTALNLDFNAK